MQSQVKYTLEQEKLNGEYFFSEIYVVYLSSLCVFADVQEYMNAKTQTR